MNRHEQRKKIFQLIFQMDHGSVELENTAFYDLYNEYEYIKRIIDFYLDNSETVDEKISRHLTNYTLERIPKVDRNILRTSISEIEEGDSPEKVVINEAVLLSKSYGENDSFRFINGVLKNFIKETDENPDGTEQ
ncbi:transcription antitermination factor NusB [Salinicoccus albus]|uniref:transcription antitermination factor NusB n=1 Tax=Salinicoccus albus TaxID=418756 RepID=UPI00037B643E|nr:transcription antitermination factor NusB [Salinicoccus albus]